MYNQFTGVGRLSADPETRFTTTSKQVTNFTLCCDSGYGDKKVTEFVRVVCWEKTASFVADYMKKGNLCMIIGRMQTRSWEDQQGQKKYTTEIIAQTVQNLTPKSESAGGFQEPPLLPDPWGGTGEEIPF